MKRSIITFSRTAIATIMAVFLASGGASARTTALPEMYSHSDFNGTVNLSLEKGETHRNTFTQEIFSTNGVMQDSARVQIIHNSPDMMADSVDIYINNRRVVANMAFRTATPFMNVQAGDTVVISVTASNSTDTTGAVFSDTMTFQTGMSYVLVAAGILSDTGYTPMQDFMLHSFDMARDTVMPNDTAAFIVYHGATDAPAISVTAENGSLVLVDSLAYGEFTDDYIRSGIVDANIDVRTADGDSVIGTYTLPFEIFDLGGTAFTVLASGFVNPAENNNGPAFGLFMADPQGGKLIALPQVPGANEARVQLIHNSMDMNADTVDVYINNMRVADNLAYATATPFMNVTAGESMVISFTASNSQDTTGAIFKDTMSIIAGKSYIIVASGMLNGTDNNQAFQLFVREDAREIAQNANNVSVLVHHGAPDAPEIDLATDVAIIGSLPTLGDNLAYGEFSDYSSIDTANVNIEVSISEGDSLIGTYLLPTEDWSLKGRAITIIAGGLINPDMNGDGMMEGEAFGLWVAMPEGGPLMSLNSVVASTKKVSNLEYKLAVFPNPSLEGYTNISYELVRPEEVSFSIYDLKGSLVRRVHEGNKAVGQYNLNLSTQGMSRGMYLIKMQTKSTISTLKLIVE